MPKLSLNPAPSFKATVAIPVPGADFADVEFSFQYRGRTEFDAWRAGLKDMNEVEILSSVVDGWDLDDPFTTDNLAVLAEKYMAAPTVVAAKYIQELTAARLKN